jgi:hypothetical protein
LKPKLLAVTIPLLLILSTLLFPAVAAYAPRQGDYFSYYEVENLGSGIGSYAGYSEHTVVNGTERVNGVSGNEIVSASYGYSWAWSNSTGGTKAGSKFGNYTFSSITFLYVNGTDDQTGYVNPTVWFTMNSSIPEDGTFYLLNTQMTVMSRNYSYYLPSQNRNVVVISAQGSSNYQRNDQYGAFTAKYVWSAYFDPSSGYIVGYDYVENDTNPSGNGFTYTDNLYVTSTSYPLTGTASLMQSTSSVSSTGAAASSITQYVTQYAGYIAMILVVLLLVAILIYEASRRSGRTTLPKHPSQQERPPAPPIDLTPKQQPAIQQIVIKEVVKVKCLYCGALIDSTAPTCPMCGAPRT